MFKKLFQSGSKAKTDRAPEATSLPASSPATTDLSSQEPAAVLAPSPAAEQIALKTADRDQELMTTYDNYGRRVQIARGTWRDQLLMPNIRQSWQEPDALYQFILQGLQDDFIAEMLAPAAQLCQIDANVERGHTLYAMTLLETGDLRQSEQVIQKALHILGETSILLTNLAKIQHEKGQKPERDATLWKAIELDPNNENALDWWLAEVKETQGESGYLSALQKAAALPASWRAKLWLGNYYLEQADHQAAARTDLPQKQTLQIISLQQQAIEHFEQVLETNGTPAVMQLVIDSLKPFQLSELIIGLIEPGFTFSSQYPGIAIELVRAYLQLQQTEPAQNLLQQLYRLQDHRLHPQLEQLEHQLQTLRHPNLKMTLDETSISNMELETLEFTKPIWQYTLSTPDGWFAEKTGTEPEIAFLNFTRTPAPAQPENDAQAEHTSQNNQVGPEDDIGRLTRTIPLYLAESVHHWTDYQTSTIIPVIQNQGPVVMGTSARDPILCQQFKGSARYLVTGEIDRHGKQIALSMYVFDTTTDSCIFHETMTTSQERLGQTVLQLEDKLLQKIGLLREASLDSHYARPTAELMVHYLVTLGQNLMFSLVVNDILLPAQLWGERQMLDWSLNLALHCKQADVPKLLYLSALAKASSYHSPVLSEFQKRTEQLLLEARQSGSRITELSPVVSALFSSMTTH